MESFNLAKVALHGLFTGMLVFIILLIAVFATGSTFGQRCEVKFQRDSTEWQECVLRLNKGGVV